MLMKDVKVEDMNEPQLAEVRIHWQVMLNTGCYNSGEFLDQPNNWNGEMIKYTSQGGKNYISTWLMHFLLASLNNISFSIHLD
jgi:hypothetical protein